MKKITLEKFGTKLGSICAACIFTCLTTIVMALAISITAYILRWLMGF